MDALRAVRGSRTAVAGLLLAVLLVALGAWRADPAHASGCSNTWTNASGGSWSTASNWSKKKVPAEGEEVCVTAAGTYTVTLEAGTPTLKALSVGAASGTQTLLLTAGNCNAAEVSSEGLVIGANARLRMSSTTSCASVRLSGPVTNAGTLAVEAGAGGTRTIAGALTNTGSVSVEGEASASAGTWTNEGTVSLAKASKLSFACCGSTGFVNAPGATVSSPGEAVIESAENFTQASANAITGTQVKMTGAGTLSLTGAGAVSILDTGSVGFTGTVHAAQNITIESHECSGVSLTAGNSFTNAGTITLTGTHIGSGQCGYAELHINNSGTLTNTGTLNIEDNNPYYARIAADITNSGTLNVHESTAHLEGALTNTGSVSVEGEASASAGTWTNEGTVSLAKASKLSFACCGSTGFVNAPGATVSSPGEAVIESAENFTQASANAITGTQVKMTGAGTLSLTGAGAVSILDTGSVGFTGTVHAAQNITIESHECSGVSLTAGNSFTNAGTITLTGTHIGSGQCGYAELHINNSGTLTNTGTLNIEDNNPYYARIAANITNSHVVAVAAEVELPLEGAYTQTSTGTLEAAIHGKSPGHIVATGLVTLAGGLKISQSAFEGKAGEQTTILSGSNRTGEFARVSGAQINPSLYWRPVYLGKTMALEATAGEAPAKPPAIVTRPQVEGAVKQGSTIYTTNGSWTNAPFEYTYQWLRCDGSGANCKAIAGATGQAYLLTGGDVGHRISVQVTAYNAGGESSPAEPASPTEAIAGVPLEAIAGEDVSVVAGEPVLLDGSGSAPAQEISNYRWQFGDDSEAEGPADAAVRHPYATAGDRKARLTVTRGSEQRSDELTVHVLAKPKAGEGARVTVRDPGKEHVEGATVLYVGPSGSRAEATSASSGEAVLAGLPPGEDTVYVYKPGFKAATGKLTVDAAGNGTTTVNLQAGEVATAGVKSHELKPAEIEAAGIDPSNPANQHVYEFEVKLVFHGEPVQVEGDVNGSGEFVGHYGVSGGGGGGGGWSCSPSECTGSGAGGEQVVIVPAAVEGHPLIQELILRGKVAVLKQFFEVEMDVQNLSGEEPFTLAEGTATLNVPSGMSLAPTSEPQQAAHSIAAIPPGESAHTTWIVRGDDPGSYNLSAAYVSKLKPFEAPVELLAAPKEALVVYGADALGLSVEADSGFLHQGYPYHVRINVRDNAPVPLYNVQLSVNPDIKERFLFQPGQRFSERLAELQPGQEIHGGYILVPDDASEGALNTSLSSIEFVGQPGTKGKVTEVTPPEPYEGGAIGDQAEEVHLHWDPVPGAEGYEIFSTPTRDTAFASLPDRAAPSPTGARTTNPLTGQDAYLEGTGGKTRFYAISAIVEGRPTLAIPLVPASANGGGGLPELGRCLQSTEKQGNVTVGTGAYTDSKCTKESASHTGKYEFTPGPGAAAGLSLSGGKTTLETVGKTKIACKTATGTGLYTGTQSVTATLAFHECVLSSNNAECTSEGGAAGEVRTAALHGTLGFISGGAKPTAGWDLEKETAGGHLASLTCGSTTVALDGSFVAPVGSLDKQSTSFKLKAKAKKGIQAPTKLIGQAEDVLSGTFGGGAPEQTGLSTTATLTGEEPLEIKAIE